MSFSRLKKHRYQKVPKFAFFTEGLVHSSGQKVKKKNFLGQIDEKECMAMFMTENELFRPKQD